ncbi:TPA: hypothetical protein DDZ86_03185 [Candidatus Dependentiae bacterium]|nr:MAG: hypothetical protein UW09_C0001G0011 [candidate division TM6 bacterium GW2011_GWF2_43_87]HBL98620.1 hypothetical protein [Candidatus Dependentiae bacterium]
MFKKVFLCGWVSTLLVGTGTLTALGVEDLYHLDSHILKKSVGLNFLHGFVLCKTPNIVRNLYVYGRLVSPLTPLVQSLFWQIDDEEEPFALRKSVFAVIPPYWSGCLVALARFCPDEFVPEKALFYSSLMMGTKIGEVTKEASGAEYSKYCVAHTLRTVVELLGDSNEKIRCPKLWRKLRLLVDAMKWSKGSYDKTFPLTLFLAFFCDFSMDRRALCDFIKGFADVAFLCKKRIFTAEGRKIFCSDTQAFNQFCSQKYPLDFYKKLSLNATFEERVIARIQAKHLFVPTLKNFGSRHFADCVETCLVKLVGELLSSDKSMGFDSSLLPQEGVDHKKLNQFISDFGAYDANDAYARLQWFRGVGNCKNATYAFSWNKVSVGLMPTESNVLGALNKVMGTSAKDYEELGKCLSTPKRSISFKIVQSEKSKLLLTLSILGEGACKRIVRIALINHQMHQKSHGAILYSSPHPVLRAASVPLFGPAIAFLANPLESSLTSRFLNKESLKDSVEKLVSFARVKEKLNDVLVCKDLDDGELFL